MECDKADWCLSTSSQSLDDTGTCMYILVVLEVHGILRDKPLSIADKAFPAATLPAQFIRRAAVFSSALAVLKPPRSLAYIMYSNDPVAIHINRRCFLQLSGLRGQAAVNSTPSHAAFAEETPSGGSALDSEISTFPCSSFLTSACD